MANLLPMVLPYQKRAIGPRSWHAPLNLGRRSHERFKTVMKALDLKLHYCRTHGARQQGIKDVQKASLELHPKALHLKLG
jgi:hypothetical protein